MEFKKRTGALFVNMRACLTIALLAFLLSNLREGCEALQLNLSILSKMHHV